MSLPAEPPAVPELQINARLRSPAVIQELYEASRDVASSQVLTAANLERLYNAVAAYEEPPA